MSKQFEPITREELLKRLRELDPSTTEGDDWEHAHKAADDLIVRYLYTIDQEVAAAFDAVGKWYG